MDHSPVKITCTVAFGLFPGTFFAYAELAAGQLVEPDGYIRAVLGEEVAP